MQIDDVLNEAQLLLVESLYSGKPIQGFPFGFEVTQQRSDMLSVLTVGSNEQPPLTPLMSSNNVYEYNLSGLVYPYMHTIRLFISDGNCTPFEVIMVDHDDLNKYLRSDN